MDCNEYREFVSSVNRHGGLDKTQQAEEHVAGCPECRRWLKDRERADEDER